MPIKSYPKDYSRPHTVNHNKSQQLECLIIMTSIAVWSLWVSVSLLPHKWAIKVGLLVKMSIFMQVLWLKPVKPRLIVWWHFTGPQQHLSHTGTFPSGVIWDEGGGFTWRLSCHQANSSWLIWHIIEAVSPLKSRTGGGRQIHSFYKVWTLQTVVRN